MKRRRRSVSQDSFGTIAAVVEVVAVLDYSVWSWMSGSDVTAAGETDTLMNLYLYFAHIIDTVSDIAIPVMYISADLSLS